jgi:hypothetical protein
MRNDIVRQTQLHLRDKANGVKHTPLHTFQECCEAADIDPRAFGRYAVKYPNAPQPVLQHAKTPWKAGKKYYRKHEFVQWVNQVRQQKEKAMPDIKTALEKALAQTANAWAADDEAHQQIQPQQEKTMTLTVEQHTDRVTTNISRLTFEFIRDNPGLTHAQVTARLVAQGFKENTVSSLTYQMIRVRLIVADANGGLTAVVREYVPIQPSSLRKKKPKAKAKPVQDVAPAPEPTPRKHVEIVNIRTGEVINPRKEEWSVESVIGNLNVRQAMAVYDELRKIFGA